MSVYTVIWKKNTSGGYDYVNASKTETSTPTGIEELVNSASVNVFPNPVTGSLYVNMNVIKSCAITFNICDITGRRLSSTENTLKQGTSQQVFNTASLAPGVYILDIQTESGTIQKKFVKE